MKGFPMDTSTPPAPGAREYGIVLSFQGRYAFIARDVGGADLFCHHTGIRKTAGIQTPTLIPGSRVSFVVVQGPRGIVAQDCHMAGPVIKVNPDSIRSAEGFTPEQLDAIGNR